MSFYGIPALLKAPLATAVPSRTWSRYKRVDAADTLFIFRSGRWDDRSRGGTLGFWTADFRLESLWTRRDRYTQEIIRGNWSGVCVPDFSLWRGEARAVHLHQLWRSRTLAVTWQAAGVPILPCLQWADRYTLDVCLEGIPRLCPVLGVQVRTVEPEAREDFIASLRYALAEIRPGKLLAYGRPQWFLDWVEQQQLQFLVQALPSPTDVMRAELSPSNR